MFSGYWLSIEPTSLSETNGQQKHKLQGPHGPIDQHQVRTAFLLRGTEIEYMHI